jgi:hypothetical protein
MSDHSQEHDDIIEMDIDGDGDMEPISEHDPAELATAYIAETYGDAGWTVNEVSGNVNFGMVTVILGRYDESGDETETAEGHGTSIPEAIDDALGQTAE